MTRWLALRKMKEGNRFDAMKRARDSARIACLLTALATPALAQTVRVDATPGHVINTFDPDSALGSSIDVLSRTGIDKVYTEPEFAQLIKDQRFVELMNARNNPGAMPPH